jgi:hypothetical protein
LHALPPLPSGLASLPAELASPPAELASPPAELASLPAELASLPALPPVSELAPALWLVLPAADAPLGPGAFVLLLPHAQANTLIQLANAIAFSVGARMIWFYSGSPLPAPGSGARAKSHVQMSAQPAQLTTFVILTSSTAPPLGGAVLRCFVEKGDKDSQAV